MFATISLWHLAGTLQVEVLLPEFWDPASGAIFSDEGDQQRFWNLIRRFLDDLRELTGLSGVRVVY